MIRMVGNGAESDATSEVPYKKAKHGNSLEKKYIKFKLAYTIHVSN